MQHDFDHVIDITGKPVLFAFLLIAYLIVMIVSLGCV